jgi:hypothetical protein
VGLDVHAKAYQISDGKLIGLKYLYLIVLPLRCEVVVGCAHASTRVLQVAVWYSQTLLRSNHVMSTQ